MTLTIEELKSNYSKLSDSKLIKIATVEADGLSPEAVEVLREEIKKRGLSIGEAIEIQRKEISEEDLLGFCDKLRTLPCPSCKSVDKKLNATMTGTAISFIVFTNYEKLLKIACPDCLDKYNEEAINKSLLLGWWGFPWGVIRTIQALNFNNKMKQNNHFDTPNDLFKSFTLGAIGRIEASGGHVDSLKEIITNV